MAKGASKDKTCSKHRRANGVGFQESKCTPTQIDGSRGWIEITWAARVRALLPGGAGDAVWQQRKGARSLSFTGSQLALTLTAAKGLSRHQCRAAAGADVVACCSTPPLKTHPSANIGPPPAPARAPPEYVRSAPGATSCSLRETVRETFTCGQRPHGSRSVSPPLFTAPGWAEWALIRFDVKTLYNLARLLSEKVHAGFLLRFSPLAT